MFSSSFITSFCLHVSYILLYEHLYAAWSCSASSVTLSWTSVQKNPSYWSKSISGLINKFNSVGHMLGHHVEVLTSLSNNKMLNHSNLKDFADDKIKMTEKLYLVFRRIENTILFPNKPWFLRVCSRSLLKTLWGKKEKLLVTSNFSFSHSELYPFEKLSAIFIKFEIVVYKLFQFGRDQYLLFGKGL